MCFRVPVSKEGIIIGHLLWTRHILNFTWFKVKMTCAVFNLSKLTKWKHIEEKKHRGKIGTEDSSRRISCEF